MSGECDGCGGVGGDCSCDELREALYEDDCDCNVCKQERGECHEGCEGCECGCHSLGCMIYGSQISCGVKEWSGVSSYRNPKVALQSLYQWMLAHQFSAGIILYSDVINRTIGVQIAEFIEANGLGTVTSTPQARNPNSGNTIMVWAWCWDVEKFNAMFAPTIQPSSEDTKAPVS